jgi:hypothetical protein
VCLVWAGAKLRILRICGPDFADLKFSISRITSQTTTTKYGFLIEKKRKIAINLVTDRCNNVAISFLGSSEGEVDRHEHGHYCLAFS